LLALYAEMSDRRRSSTSLNDGGGSVGKDKDLDIKCRQFFVAKLGRLMGSSWSANSSNPSTDSSATGEEYYFKFYSSLG
jgi:hypothetical protein